VGHACANFCTNADDARHFAGPDPGRISPDLTQAAYRIGDSSTNIITPLMPYFPLVVVYCQRYVKNTGIGTLAAMMLPYSITFLVLWTVFLLLYWMVGLPLGLQSSYEYIP
jgi:aminobenzoyl-glutamate transport protein